MFLPENLRIGPLIITQENLRSPENIEPLIEYVSNGGTFFEDDIKDHDPDGFLIEISRFEDGQLFLHDGHHRCVAAWIAGRSSLSPKEYNVTDWKYSDYDDIVFLYPDGSWMGWVTPFDIRTHVRNHDILEFKGIVKDLYYDEGEDVATQYILNHVSVFRHDRVMTSIEELAQKVSGQLPVGVA